MCMELRPTGKFSIFLNVFYPGTFFLARFFKESEMKEVVNYNIEIANECINESFKKAGSNIRINVLLDKVSILNQEKLDRIGYNPYQPDKDLDGNIIKGEFGATTDNHIVRYFDSEVNHATYYFNNYLQELIQSEEFRPILLVESFVKRTAGFLMFFTNFNYLIPQLFTKIILR